MSTEVEAQEQVAAIIPAVTSYIHDLADALVGFIEVGDAFGAISALHQMNEAICPIDPITGERSPLAQAYVDRLLGNR